MLNSLWIITKLVQSLLSSAQVRQSHRVPRAAAPTQLPTRGATSLASCSVRLLASRWSPSLRNNVSEYLFASFLNEEAWDMEAEITLHCYKVSYFIPNSVSHWVRQGWLKEGRREGTALAALTRKLKVVRRVVWGFPAAACLNAVD